MNKLAFIVPLVLLGGCAAMTPPPEGSTPTKPNLTSTEIQTAIDQAIAQALAAEQANGTDVETTVNRAVEKALADSLRELRAPVEKTRQVQVANDGGGDLQRPPASDKKGEPVEAQGKTRVGAAWPMMVHPTVALKREIRDCTLELLMYDTHVADATDACLRIYRSQHLRERWRNGAGTVRTSTLP